MYSTNRSLFIGWLTVAFTSSLVLAFEPHSIICQRLPNNPNCRNSINAVSTDDRSSRTRNDQPIAPPSQTQTQSQPQLPPQLPPQQAPATPIPPPWQLQPQPQPVENQPSAQDLQKACQSMQANYDQHCIPGAQLSEAASSFCVLFVERCQNGVVPKQSFSSKWMQLTRQAQQRETLQQVDSTEKWLYDCGTYNLPYNGLCYPNASNFFCNSLRRVCLSHAEDLAAGQTPVNGPFAHNNGLPTGGAGSSRPITWGNNVGIGPFFNLGANQALNPLQGYGNSAQLQVPIAGVGATISKGVDYGGVIGLTQLAQILDRGRRRKRAITLSEILTRYKVKKFM